MIIKGIKLNQRCFLRVSMLLLVCLFSVQQGYANLSPIGGDKSVKETLMPQDDRITIEGVVTDAEFGDPMIGVSVVQKGTTNGTMTDTEGKFTLKAPANSTIVISFLGFKTKEIKLAGETMLKVSLEEDTHMLGEVVTIGYGSARKEDLSMAISSVKVDQSMKSGTSNINTILQGKLPGVTIQSVGGDPLKSATISIRGRGSKGRDNVPNLRGSKAREDGSASGDGVLFVVDGVPNAPYNVEDVESVTVLKDAASSAIYGANAGSGGVVIITTKQAKEGKIKINLNVSHGIKNATNLPKVLSAEQYNMVWAKTSEIEGRDLPSINDPVKFPWGNVTRTDWVDEIFRTAHVQHYALSLSGGDQNAKTFASVSYDKEQGTLLNTWAQKIGAKLNVDLKLAKWLTLRENITFQYSTGQGDVNTSHEGPFIESVRYPRSATVYEYDKEGKPVRNDKGTHLYGGTIPAWATNDVSGYGPLRNPVAELERLNQHRPTTTIYSTTTLEARPLSRLTLKSDFTAGHKTSRIRKFHSRVPEIGRDDPDNNLVLETDWGTNWLWESTATYVENFADKHDISLMGGYTMDYKRYRYNDIIVFGFADEDDLSTIIQQGSDFSKEPPFEEHWIESMISGFARASYSFDDRYFVTGSVRRDATSKLPSKHRADMFYAASGSWKVSSEQFFKNLNLPVNLFKLRASWGQTGNVNAVGRYGNNVPMGSYGYYANMGGDRVLGFYQKTILNPNLKWETSEQTSFGLDLVLLDNSLDISVDYFNKDTKDIIDYLPVTVVMGLDEEPWGNLGLINNRGWEFSASYSKTIGDLSFNVYGNLSTVKNEVKDLGTRSRIEHGITSDGLKPLKSTQGQPWYSFLVYETAGVFKDQDAINAYMHKDPITGETSMIQPNAKPGDFILRDTNNDGKISDDDMTYQGSYLPKITYAFGSQVNYKGFDLNIMFQGVGGNKIFNGFRQMGLNKGSQGFNMLSEVLDSWSFNPDSHFPSLPTTQSGGKNYQTVSDFYIESGSYLRLKNVTLGYTLPKSLLAKAGMHSSSLRFYVSGENLATITPYSGTDPEVGNYGVDVSTYPLARTFTFGLNFSF